jgi:hypothetical protein
MDSILEPLAPQAGGHHREKQGARFERDAPATRANRGLGHQRVGTAAGRRVDEGVAGPQSARFDEADRGRLLSSWRARATPSAPWKRRGVGFPLAHSVAPSSPTTGAKRLSAASRIFSMPDLLRGTKGIASSRERVRASRRSPGRESGAVWSRGRWWARWRSIVGARIIDLRAARGAPAERGDCLAPAAIARGLRAIGFRASLRPWGEVEKATVPRGVEAER